MAVDRISKRSVDALQPEVKDVYLWVAELSGFGLQGHASRTQGLFGPAPDRRAVGPHSPIYHRFHGVLTAEQARVEAKRLLGEVAAGRDPADQKQQAKGSTSLGQVLNQFLTMWMRS